MDDTRKQEETTSNNEIPNSSMPYSMTRDITIMALVVSCNVALEISLGTALHALNFPLTGSLMVVINAFAYALAFFYCPRFGRVTLMGIATALVTLIMAGGFKFTVLPSIIGEALLIDVLMSTMGLSRLVFVVCGACASLSTLGFKLFNAQVFRGMPLDQALTQLADNTATYGGLKMAILVIVSSRIIAGAVFAWLIWGALVRLRRVLYPGRV